VSTLAETLTVREPPRAPDAVPDAETRGERERLCDFLRRAEGRVFVAEGTAKEEIRRLLGWDDATLAAFAGAPLVTHSSPHTGMNFFPPMLCYAWIQKSLLELSAPHAGTGVHLRTLVMHNNLGDLRYRPYAWWHRAPDGPVVKTAFFSRGHAERRKALLALPPPVVDPEGCHPADREALAVARHGRTYATFAMLYRLHLERRAGFHRPQGLIEVPLDLLSAFTFERESLPAWAAALAGVSDKRLRIPDAGGELVPLGPEEVAAWAGREPGARAPLVCPNFLHFALVYRLGISAMLGAEKMARYVAPMNGDIAAIFTRLGQPSPPAPRLIPITRVPVEEVLPLDPEGRRVLAESGLKQSLPIAVADHGPALAGRLASLLDRDYAELYPEGGRQAESWSTTARATGPAAG
jgi:hypothetical protein